MIGLLMANTLRHLFRRMVAGIRSSPAEAGTDGAAPAGIRAPSISPPEVDAPPSGGPAGGADRPPPPIRKEKSSARHTRTGVPVIDSADDLACLFAERAATIPEEDQPHTDPPSFPEPGRREGPDSANDKRDRHGIPVLKASEDLADRFGNEPDEPVAAAEFSRLVDETLTDDQYREMIRAKKEEPHSGRESAPNRRRFRTPPRSELDLHGCTAEQGERKAEGFVRSSRAKGVDAVRIVVGRGIHSEGAAVLPGVVENLMIVLKKQGIVESFDWEGGKRGSGAILVYPVPMDAPRSR